MTKQQIAWLVWLDSRSDADDTAALAAAVGALVAAAPESVLSKAENELHTNEKIDIGYQTGYLHDSRS